MVPLGNQVTEQLNQLGISPELLQSRLGRLERAPINALSHLSAAYAQAALSTGGDKFAAEVQDGRVGMAPAWSNLSPHEAMQTRARFVHKTYHRVRVPRHASAGNMSALTGRHQRGALMVRRLHRDPVMRQAFERSTSLQVVRDGRMDGRVSVAAMQAGQGQPSGPSGGIPNNLFGFLTAMETAVLEQAQKLGVYSSTDPEVFFGEGRDLDLYGKGSHYGVSSPSTTGVFGFSNSANIGTASGNVAPPTGDQSAGLDTQVMQLKRSMDKMMQMYDLVRTVFDKYNESAKTSIGNMRA